MLVDFMLTPRADSRFMLSMQLLSDRHEVGDGRAVSLVDSHGSLAEPSLLADTSAVLLGSRFPSRRR